MTELERAARARHLNVGERPWQHFGRCSSCNRVRDDEGRPIFVTGRRRRQRLCLECFDQGLAPARRHAA